MAGGRMTISLTIFASILYQVTAQDQVQDICYGAESVVIAVIGTLVVTLGVLAGGLFLYKTYWKTRNGKHLMLVTDVESPSDQYAFDNPCFREATPIKRNLNEEKEASRLEKNKWLGWSSLSPFGKDQKTKKITSLDDSCVNNSQLKVVNLKSHDFTGLGFNICGNMRDGIFIKDVLHRGPAFESGCINSGDRIDSVCISFRNMVFEDALTILSYASPYDVQVHVENDSYSRPSTLIRSKRESNMLSSVDKIFHPKYSRSQSISHLNEIGKSSNKPMSHQPGYGTYEKNRINQSLNKSNEGSNDYPTIKLTTPTTITDAKRDRVKLEKNAAPRISPSSKRSDTPEQQPNALQNKHQKFGIKVLPMNINPKAREYGGNVAKEPPRTAMVFENEINSKKEKPDKPSGSKSPSPDSMKNKQNGTDEVDGGRENVKAKLTKGLLNLKEKINQNTLGKKKKEAGDEAINPEGESKTKKAAKQTPAVPTSKTSPEDDDGPLDISDVDGPPPRMRSPVTTGPSAKVTETKSNGMMVPEEVSRAGDVARNNRKSLNDPNSCRKSLTSLISESDAENKPKRKGENNSDSENSTDGDSPKTSDEGKKPKRSKGKAPAPPPAAATAAATDQAKDGRTSASPKQFTASEIDEIKRDADVTENNDQLSSYEADERIIGAKEDEDDTNNRHRLPSYDSDSDTEVRCDDPKTKVNGNKIELTAMQVTVHQSPAVDGTDDDKEPSRKAASLGDLSKLDSEQPLSVVLERAVSLDLADGAGQSGKKRKAPLPPSEEFPTVFDDLSYRKEPRLDTLGLNTFQRRLKKSSDFGTLEDALQDGPKSLEIEINKRGSTSPMDLTETHNSNIQEFSTWLAECRRPKSSQSETSGDETVHSRMSSTSLVNINAPDEVDKEGAGEDGKSPQQPPSVEYQATNVSYSVNGKSFPSSSVKQKVSSQDGGQNSGTVVVILQPNSHNQGVVDKASPSSSTNVDRDRHADEGTNGPSSILSEPGTAVTDHFVTASESTFESFNNKHGDDVDEEESPPPKLPTSPIPKLTTSSTVSSSPLSSSFTYITEIKVSTSQQEAASKDAASPKQQQKPESPSVASEDVSEPEVSGRSSSVAFTTSTPKPDVTNSISKRIQHFDSKSRIAKPLISPIKTKSSFGTTTDVKTGGSPPRRDYSSFEPSRIPIKTMKSETGQKVLATIQSLTTKDASPPKIPEVEYAKRVASLFTGTNSLERNQLNLRRKSEETGEDGRSSNVSGFYLKGSETGKESNHGRRVPPTVPPRKIETSLTNSKSSVTIDLPGKRHQSGPGSHSGDKSGPNETIERNIVTFSSFIPKNQNEESASSTLISFKIK